MQQTTATIFRKLGEIERSLQELKVDLLFSPFKKQKAEEIYKEQNILRELRKIRRRLWNEKYSKAV